MWRSSNTYATSYLAIGYPHAPPPAAEAAAQRNESKILFRVHHIFQLTVETTDPINGDGSDFI
jgi:hypothetical protein